jgi:peroxiredoxin
VEGITVNATGVRSAQLLLMFCLFLAPASSRADDSVPTARLGTRIADVTLRDASGGRVALHALRGKKATVVVFLSFDCPLSRDYAPVLAELAATYRDTAFVGIGVGEEDAARLAKLGREFGLTFPVVPDAEGRAGDAFGARVTPETFVLDADFVLRYRGRIDDAYVARLKKKNQATRHDLRRAVDDLLAGRPIAEPATRAIGCPIPQSRARAGSADRKTRVRETVTFHREVLPILQARCQSCHRPGAVGPFPLLTYRQAVTWADDIKEYTRSRKMPPWKPTEGGPFHEERKLTEEEIATLSAWVDGGTPAGDPKDAPPPRAFPDGWQLGQPDLVVTVRDDFQLAARGPDVYRYFVLPTNLPRDTYVAAVEVRPGNRRIVHHAVLFVDSKGRGRRLEEKQRERSKMDAKPDRGPGYETLLAMLPGFLPEGGLGGWAPGMVVRRLPDEAGYLLPKGADVLLQIHYHRSGRAETDRTSVGLYFARNASARRVRGLVVPASFLLIPAGAERYQVRGSVTVQQPCRLHAIMPHMHFLGREIKVTMLPPGGPPRTLVAVRDWDFNWQELYFFTETIPVPANTRFEVEGVFNNSAANPANPTEPPRPVLAGLETRNEMCAGFLAVTHDRPGPIRFDIRVKIPGLDLGPFDVPAFGF